MQAIMETLFDVIYLLTVTTMGIWVIKNSNGEKGYKLFGIMAVILGCGDAFHLIPRAYGLCTTSLEANATALGIGKLVTSITMTIFYVILYHIWRWRYKIKGRKTLTITMYVLAGVRILLCLMPQNDWLNYHAPLSWGIFRNIPFAIIGIIMIVLFFNEARKANDSKFKYMWLAILLSFGFYVPVVLFADLYPIVGILMIPKTCAYVWIVSMGFGELREKLDTNKLTSSR